MSAFTPQTPGDYQQQIDLLIYQKDYQQAANVYFQLLDALCTRWSETAFSQPDYNGNPDLVSHKVAQRAARQWLQILSSNIDLSKLDLTLLLENMHGLHAILLASEQGSLDSLFKGIHRRTGGQYTQQDFFRLLLSWSPGSRINFAIFNYHNHAPEIIMAHAIACVAGIGLYTAECEKYRNNAIEFLIKKSAADLQPYQRLFFSVNLRAAWMRCSYGDHPEKHKVKILFNRMISQGFGTLPATRPAKTALSPRDTGGKPLMIVPLETFRSSHAMYRCYSRILQACRDRFYTIGLAEGQHQDEGTRALFDECHDARQLSGETREDHMVNMPSLLQILNSWKPDIIYYPSIGMNIWVIALANQRIAPVQTMTIGHPASSYSPCIDNVLLDEYRLGNDRLFSESPIKLPHASNPFVLPPSALHQPPVLSLPDDGILRVAIPSIAQKLTPGFIRALQSVEQKLGDRVRFVFFIGERSLVYAAATRMLHRCLNHIEYYSLLDYNDYIGVLNQCQLHAGTFPFGGTNSVVDSLRQCIPVLAYEGEEPHARVDPDFVRRAGLPADEFVATSEADYADKLHALLSNPERLLHWRHYLHQQDNIDRVFLQQGQPHVYAQAMQSLLKGHTTTMPAAGEGTPE